MSNDIIQHRRSLLASTYRLFYEDPVVVDRAEGVWIVDSGGNRLLDGYNNVPIIGHSNPQVAEAVYQQLQRVNTHTRYADPVVVNYADRLLAKFPADLDSVVFTCSGSEANDLSLRAARAATGHQGLIVTSHAYHGTTEATASISPSLTEGLEDPHAEVVRVGVGDSSEEYSARFTEEVVRAIERLGDRGIRPAAVILDTSMTSDGIFTDPPGFLNEGIEVARQAGALFIADEVQAGFCRMGTWWGFQHHRLHPDLVTLGKPMGNGLPVAGVVAKREIMDTLGSRYFNTFAGTPVPLAAAGIVLDELDSLDTATRTRDLGEKLRAGLREAADSASMQVEVRGAGLMVGLDLSPHFKSAAQAGQAVRYLVNDMRRRHVLVSHTGSHGEVLKIRPPLVITEEGIHVIASAVREGLRGLHQLSLRGEESR